MLTARYAALLLLILAGSARTADQTVANCATDAELRSDLTAMQASGGGTLTFACAGTPTIILTAQLPDVTTATTLDGGGIVTLSGGNAHRLLLVAAGATLTLRGITIANALAANDGGAIRSSGTLVVEDSRFQNNQSTGQSGGAILALGPLTIRRSTFVNNVAVNGGAIYPRFPPAVVTIEDSVFDNNRATGLVDGSGFGGAILAWDGAQVTIERTRFVANRARDGGAIFNTANSQLVVRRSTFDSNGGVGVEGVFPHGGGLRNFGVAMIQESLFVANVSAFGGAVENDGTLDVVNSTFSGHFNNGGGALRNQGTVTLLNVTFAANGTITLVHTGPAITIRNTVIDHTGSGGLAPTACASATPSAGFNLVTDFSCGFNQPGDRQGIGSGLGPLAENGGPTRTHLPAGNSPLVDGGTIMGCPGVDQRGRPRPEGLSCDIGAVESGPEIFANGFE